MGQTHRSDDSSKSALPAHVERREIPSLTVAHVDALVSELQNLAGTLAASASRGDDMAHLRNLLRGLDEVVARGQFVRRTAARVGMDNGMSAREVSELVEASQNTIHAWVQRNRAELG